MREECVSQVPLLDIKIYRASIRDYSNHTFISWYIKMYYMLPEAFLLLLGLALGCNTKNAKTIFINNIYL